MSEQPTPPTSGADGPPEDPPLPDWLEPLRQAARRMRGEDISQFLPPEDPRPREGAVLVLFGEGPSGPDVLLTERSHLMRSQPGQIAFPGGGADEGESAVEAALREAQEETGLDPRGVDVFAVLPRLYLPPRNFAVAPVLAYWREESAVSVVDPREVHEVYRVPVSHLLDPAHRWSVRHPLGYRGPGWTIGPEGNLLLWGFTAGILDAIFDAAGWTREWDRERERALPEHMIEWHRIAKLMGVELPDGDFDPVAAGLVPEDYLDLMRDEGSRTPRDRAHPPDPTDTAT